MGSPLSPIVANLFMEKFEKKALDSYPLKPKSWVRFVDDTSVNWPHGENELNNFLDHLNSMSEDIKFTMEVEENNWIPFLDILLIRRNDGSIGHKVFRKKAHTDSYLHADSHHHPAQKMGVLQTLFTRAYRISDINHTEEEISYLKRTFANLGYNNKSIYKAIQKAKSDSNINKVKDPPTSNAHLPYIQGVTDKIAKILKKKNIKTTFKPWSTIKQRMKSVKDSQEHLQQKGVYIINCSCADQYIGETGRSVRIRLKKHSADIRNERTHSSALAEHVGKTNHHICLEDAKVIAKEDHHFKRKVREAIEIIKHPRNLNRDGGLEISKNWNPLLTPHE